MKKNNSLGELAKEISLSKRIYIFPHQNADGDALGSAAGLCLGLREMGKEAEIILNEESPKSLQFLTEGLCQIFAPDLVLKEDFLAISVDCGDLKRIDKRQDLFLKGKAKMAIDHHPTTEPIWDFNYIDSKAAATGEIIYDLLKEIGCPISKPTGERLLAAISTDTGSFQYSNVTAKTHQIAAELYQIGVDSKEVYKALYESQSLEKLRLESQIIASMRLLFDGRVAISHIDKRMLDETGAKMDDGAYAVSIMRSIEGVEVAILLKEREPGKISLSTRSKSYYDVSAFCSSFGGGGHVRASGGTIMASLEEAYELIIDRLSVDFQAENKIEC